MAAKVAIPAKVHIEGKEDITRIVTGYCGDKVRVEADGHEYHVDKDKISADVHAKLNEKLRKGA